MNKLVYYSIGYNVNYNKLLELSLISLKLYYTDDILIISDEKNIKYLKNKKIFNDPKISFMILDSSNIFNSTLNKMKIYEYEKFNNYDSILYLDCDTIVIKNLDIIFENTKNLNKILITEEIDNITNIKNFNMNADFFSGFMLFDENDKKTINDNNIKGLNTGVFCLPTTDKTKQILHKMCNHYINNYNLNIIYNTLEQPYMNYYLFKDIYYYTINKYVKIIHLYLISDIIFVNKLFENSDICVLHFVGPGPGQFEKKYKFMLKLFPNKYLKYLN